jgi:two-component system OmpR family response regulator
MSRKRVLIVDDERLIVVSTRLVLEIGGFEVVSADDGETGIRAARQLKPDVILLDIMMPGIDGWEALRRLKESEETREIPVVIFTARENWRGRERALDLGAVDFFRKPFEPEDLISLVGRHASDVVLN